VVPSTRVVTIKGADLKYGYQNFVASTASVVGNVTIGEITSVWYGGVVRGACALGAWRIFLSRAATAVPPRASGFAGDRQPVTVGRNTAILDNASVSSSKTLPTRLGNDVTVGAGASVSSADVGDGTMIGMGAVVLPGARIGNDCFIDAGAVVLPGTVVPSGTLWTGNPARQLRHLKSEEMSYLRTYAGLCGALSQRHFEQSRLSPEAIEAQEERQALKRERGLKPTDELPALDADVIQYYKLTTKPDDTGLLRAAERDVGAELALREAEEVAADRAENAAHAQAARLKRVGAALKRLAGTRADRPAQAAQVASELAAVDPEGAAMLKELVARVGEAAAAAPAPAGNDDARAALLAAIQRIDPGLGFYGDDKEAKDAAAAIFASVARIAAAGGAAGGPLAGAAAGVGASARPLA